MEATLRQIVSSYYAVHGSDLLEDEAKFYQRVRKLRDDGLIYSTNPPSQGRITLFNQADIIAAVLVMTCSVNGMKTGIARCLLQDLRTFGPNGEKHTSASPAFENAVEPIAKGTPCFVRLDIFNAPWGFQEAHLGDESILTETRFFFPERQAFVSQRLAWSLTELAKPVLDHIEETNAA